MLGDAPRPPDTLGQALGIDVVLKVGALFTFFFVSLGYSYELGRTGKTLNALVTEPKKDEPGLHSTLTAGALHLGHILAPCQHQQQAWPSTPVIAGLLLLYACFLTERLRDKSADRTNLSFVAAVLMTVIFIFLISLIHLYNWRFLVLQFLLLIVAPLVIFFVQPRFHWLRIPSLFRCSPWSQMITVAVIGMLLAIAFIASFADGYYDKTGTFYDIF